MQQQLNKPYLWSHSQIGASHIRKEKPNQDSVGILSLANDSVHILAVSDGHGSERYCRSDIGSKLAVKAARHVCEQFFDPLPTLSEIKTRLDMVARKILFTWREEVQEHCQRFPLNENEIALLKNPDDIKVAYGATLVIAVITPKYAIYLQLGDGDIVVIDHEQKVFSPIAPDKDVLGVETHSLCEKEPEKYWRIASISYEQMPNWVLLATDGYANSYANNTSFLNMLEQLYQKTLQHGLGALLDVLPSWLEDTTQHGSGDDISVALLSTTSFSPKQTKPEYPSPSTQSHLIDLDKAEDIAALNMRQKVWVLSTMGKSIVQDMHHSLLHLKKHF